MRWIKPALLLLLAVVLIPIGLVTVYFSWLKFEQDRFYAERPLLGAMRMAWLRRPEDANIGSAAASEALLRNVPAGSARTSVARALSAEGFGCQESVTDPVAVDCQQRVPAVLGFTHWIIELYVEEPDQLSRARVRIWNIFI